MNILSLFDGISCGMVALERFGISVDKYFAYEIDKYAISMKRNDYKLYLIIIQRVSAIHSVISVLAMVGRWT